MKCCPKCGQLKPRADFYRNRAQADGLGSMCKPCQNVANADWRKRHLDRHRQYNLKWRLRHPQEDRERARRYYQRHPEKRKHPYNVPMKRARHILYKKAIPTGFIRKPEVCSRCRCWFPPREIWAFWKDYERPLEVQWLCRRCHFEASAQKREAV